MGSSDSPSDQGPANPPDGDQASPGPNAVLPQLFAARDRLEQKDLPAALALYEEALLLAGDRADVLVTISGDLGVNGYVREIIELVAPRYDAERHGPATGLNVLQAYLAVRNAEAAQHVLDILFALRRPELEDRLYGFSNAIADLIQQDLPPLEAGAGGTASAEVDKVNLVSLSKPIWFYGFESLVDQILPTKANKIRRVAFTQLALPGATNIVELARQPENELSRLTRAIPLWLAETFYFSPHYLPIAAVGVMNQKHYALFGPEWTVDNLRQLVNTTDGGLDYIFTGAIRQIEGDYEMVLRVWEVKKFRERKTFNVRWTSANADTELAKFHEQVRGFMEWSPDKSGVIYAAPERPTVWLHTLGVLLSLFFLGKHLLPKEQVGLSETLLDSAAVQAGTGESASLAWLTLRRGMRELGLPDNMGDVPLRPTPLVESASTL